SYRQPSSRFGHGNERRSERRNSGIIALFSKYETKAQNAEHKKGRCNIDLFLCLSFQDLQGRH
ncbi:hypothetical protein, partial [Vibrio lentus]|uniref:hypothetical protein n=1 Tax=Vibrio lentus TaxID=136468 RepID=UPI0019D1E064